MMLPPLQEVLMADATLRGIVSDRIFQTIAPEDKDRPYIVWSIISSVPGITLGCLPEYDDQRTRVDCYSLKQSECRRMAEAARDAIEAYTPVTLMMSFYESEDTRLFRWMIDAEWIHSR